jgi:hypothetical protein
MAVCAFGWAQQVQKFNGRVGKSGYQRKDGGANDELQGLSLRDNDSKPRCSEIGRRYQLGVHNVEPCHTTRSLRHRIPSRSYRIFMLTLIPVVGYPHTALRL